MDKQANPWADTAINAAMLGGGGFATIKLLEEIMRAAQRPPTDDGIPLDKSLHVDIPKAHPQLYKTSEEFLKQADSLLGSITANLIGAPAGFLGTKAIYDLYKRKQNERDIEAANQKYLEALSQLSKASEDKTPALNAYCDQLAETVIKAAGAQDIVNALKGYGGAALNKVKNFAAPVTNPIKDVAQTFPKATALTGLTAGVATPLAAQSWAVNHPDGWLNKAMQRPAEGKHLDNLMDSVPGKETVKDWWKVLALLMTGVSGGSMIMAHQDKQKKENRKQFPQAVELNYV